MRTQKQRFWPQLAGKHVFRGLFVFWILTIPMMLYAQKHALKFEHLSVERGLSDGIITGILQDMTGFLWIGTDDGLNRYDGYTVTRYKHHLNNPYSLGANMILTLYEDQRGTLWIATSAGLQVYDRESDRFRPALENVIGAENLADAEIAVLYEDRAERLWIGTDKGLYQYDRDAGQLVRAGNAAEALAEAAEMSIRTMLEDQAGTLWLGTDSGLYQYDGHALTRYEHDPKNPASLGHNTINVLCEDRAGRLWIGGDDGGLQRFDRNAGTFSHYRSSADDPRSLSHDQVNAIYEDQSGVLWVGTLNGLNKFLPESAQFFRYLADPTNPSSLSYNEITTIFEDRSGVLWIGTEGGGLNKFNRVSEPFLHYQNNPYNPHSLSHNRVWALYQDHTGTLWVGTEVGGLNRLDPNSEQFRHYRYDPADPHSLGSDEVTALYEDHTHTLWVGTDEGGLNRFDRDTERFIRYLPNPEDPFSFSSDKVVSLYEDRAGRLWIGTDGGGLNHFDRDTGQFIRYQHDPDVPTSLSDDSVWTIAEDPAGILWLGTNHGLNAFDPATGKFSRYYANPGQPTGMSHDTIWSLCTDSAGRLWIGTDNGLDRFNLQQHTFTHYTEDDGLPNNRIYGILEGDAAPDGTGGHLWLSTAQGLCHFDPAAGVVKTYGMNELQNIMFNRGAAYKSPDGELFFGGMNGFNAFYPSAIQENSHVPPIVITDFQLFNTSVPIRQKMAETGELVLSHKDAVFSFQFAALDYTIPEENRYAYKMEGFDREWNEVGPRRVATYTNLPPGHYTFRVKGSNNDNVWNENGAAIRLMITPPFWQTLWFRLLAIFTVGGAIAAVYHLRVRMLRQQTHILEVQVRERTLELQQKNAQLQELNASKDKFFSIIAHDLKSPFNALLGYTHLISEQLYAYRSEELKGHVEKLQAAAEKLYALLENLLTWARIQRGGMEYAPEEFDMQEIAEYVLDLFTSKAEQKQIRLNNVIQDQTLVIADYNMINTVMRNLVSNALKFTLVGGEITLTARKNEHWVEVAVSDTGIGMSQENIAKLFRLDMKYTTSGTDGEPGTGLGLLLCHDLIERHGGRMWVESEPAQGTTFRFTLQSPETK